MAKTGRPRTESIPRFNVDTFLLSNQKFLRFKRSSGLSIEKCWTTLTRFWAFCASNYARKGNISDIDSVSLAEFCFWEGDENKLLTLLYEAKFIDEGGDIHDWIVHQPLVGDSLDKRELRLLSPTLSENKSSSSEIIPTSEDLVSSKLIEVKLSKENEREVNTKESLPNLSVRRNTFFEGWQKFAKEHGLPVLRKLPKSLSDKIDNRLKDPDFDENKILTSFHTLPDFWLGKTRENYKLTLEYVVRNDKNYLELLSKCEEISNEQPEQQDMRLEKYISDEGQERYRWVKNEPAV